MYSKLPIILRKKQVLPPLFSNGCWLTGCMRPSTKTPCSPVLTVRLCSYKPTTSVLRPVINTGSEPPGIRDSVATGVLQLYHPCLLLSSILPSVAGDGNCLFRALSHGLYCSEDHHIHLRLLMTFGDCCTQGMVQMWTDLLTPISHVHGLLPSKERLRGFTANCKMSSN